MYIYKGICSANPYLIMLLIPECSKIQEAVKFCSPRPTLPCLALMSCNTRGRLVTMPDPRGRKSLQTHKLFYHVYVAENCRKHLTYPACDSPITSTRLIVAFRKFHVGIFSKLLAAITYDYKGVIK